MGLGLTGTEANSSPPQGKLSLPENSLTLHWHEGVVFLVFTLRYLGGPHAILRVLYTFFYLVVMATYVADAIVFTLFLHRVN